MNITDPTNLWIVAAAISVAFSGGFLLASMFTNTKVRQAIRDERDRIAEIARIQNLNVNR